MIIATNEKPHESDVEDDENYSTACSNLCNEDIDFENHNDSNSALGSETSNLLSSTPIVGTNPMIKLKRTNHELAGSQEKNTSFLSPTDVKNDSLIHHNAQKSTLTNGRVFQTLKHQSEPGVCNVVECKSISLKEKPESNKENEAHVEIKKNKNIDNKSKKKN